MTIWVIWSLLPFYFDLHTLYETHYICFSSTDNICFSLTDIPIYIKHVYKAISKPLFILYFIHFEHELILWYWIFFSPDSRNVCLPELSHFCMTNSLKSLLMPHMLKLKFFSCILSHENYLLVHISCIYVPFECILGGIIDDKSANNHLVSSH